MLLSTTWNLTIELFNRVDELAADVPIVSGVADTNAMLLTAVGLTVIVAVAVSFPAEAVIVSLNGDVPEAHPLSL